MSYAVQVNPGRKPWRFATFAEASGCASYVQRTTGRIVGIESDSRPATHKFDLA